MISKTTDWDLVRSKDNKWNAETSQLIKNKRTLVSKNKKCETSIRTVFHTTFSANMKFFPDKI